ncbi:hypothetical protein D6C86_10031 [Aureobasidium pullulans]|nr:hypothetical protein D6C86_10031 [Aureobasidium pullulans]
MSVTFVTNHIDDSARVEDLLSRHRRHCTPNKVSSKRKSCNACVQARTKCSLGQPKCTRCIERDLSCEYTFVQSHSSVSISPGRTTVGPGAVNNISESACGSIETRPSPWSLVTMLPVEVSSNQTIQNLVEGGTDSLHWLMSDSPSLDGFVGGHAALDGLHPAPVLRMEEVSHTLREYPTSLTLDEYHTPLLHRELYNINTSDITALPKTTTAITCALGWKTFSNHAFLKRAMASERQRLVESFPNSSCIEEWDILHSMWLYELIELPGVPETVDDHWKPGPRTRGLSLPILLKMTRRFCLSHPEAIDPSAQMHRDALVRHTTAPSAWMTWLVGETARRTVFFANITNYLGSKSPVTGELSPYYEPLDDELIWNMPLPCSSAIWTARTEQEWLQALRAQDPGIGLEDQLILLSKLFNREPTLKSLMINFTKNYLLTQYSERCGLEDSGSLRNLIVRCALEQC